MNVSASINPRKIAALLFLWIMCFAVFILPIKLGTPYIDELGLSLPSLAEIIFASWPSIGLCALSLMILMIISFHLVTGTIEPVKCTVTDMLLILFLVICVLSMTRSVNFHASMIQNMMLFSAAIAFWAAKLVRCYNKTQPFFMPVYISLLVSATFVAVTGIHQYFFGLAEMRAMINIDTIKKMAILYKESQPENYALYLRLISDRIFSTFVYPNSLAGYLCIVVPFVFELFRRDKQSALRIYLWCAGLSSALLAIWFYVQTQTGFIVPAVGCAVLFPVAIIACIFLTVSQGGILTLCIMTVVYVALIYARKYKKAGKFLIAAGLVVLAGALVLFTVNKSYFSRKTASLSARVDYWNASVKMIKEHPVSGFGPGTFGSVYPKYKSASSEETQFAHNNYLQVMAETGVAGGICFLLLWIVPLCTFVRSCMKGSVVFPESAAGFAVFAFAIHGLVDFDFYIPALAFYAFFMLGLIDSSSAAVSIRLNLSSPVAKIGILAICGTIFFIGNRHINTLFQAQMNYNLGEYFFREKHDPQQAVHFLTLATLLNKSDGKLYAFLGTVYYAEKQWDPAIGAFRNAVMRNRCRGSYHYQLAQALQASGSPENKQKAILEFKKAIEYNPNRYKKYE